MFVHGPGVETLTVTVVVAAEAVAPTGLPCTWKLYEPGVTEDATLTVKPLVAPAVVGVTGLTVKLAQVIPEVRLLLTHDSVTGRAAPAVNFAATVTVTEVPCVIITGPLFDNE
jgi:hypothetical protein